MRYLRLWLSFLKMSWMADLEYRLNISVRVLGEIVWYVVQLSVFEVLYTHTETIHGWDINDMRVFMGSLFLADVLYMILFSENMDSFFTLIRKGDLDLYLVKPINSQFMVSCRKISVTYFANLLMVLGYLTWAISRLDQPVSVWQILSFAVLIGLGLVIVYSMRFMFVIITVVLQDMSSIQFIWYQLYRLATRPDRIYPNFLRFVVLVIFPIAFTASVPARILVEGLDPVLMTAAPAIAVGLLFLSNFLWERALRHYASASS